MKEYIRINPNDTVAVALRDLEAGFLAENVVLAEKIKSGHKFALARIPKGKPPVKFGFPIGTAAREISPGEWVHTHNLKSALGGAREYEYKRYAPPQAVKREPPGGIFYGYRRFGGKVGIRNEIWIIPTVGCINAIGLEIANRFRKILPNGVDGITAFAHPYGCSQSGCDHETTRAALCGLIRHPNAGGVLVMGLGCENNLLGELITELGPVDSDRVKFIQCQDHCDEIEAALPLVGELIERAKDDVREAFDISKLVVGLKCGGSDGFSGITANPLLGRFTDALTDSGGTAILTEVPEIFGAEQILMDRAADREVFDKTVKLINGFKDYFASHGQPPGENPSPGNKDGGITNLEEKSLGCVQKGGEAVVTGVLNYGETAAKAGLNILESPGNDLVASAALAISGAQLILFTTGRGTPFGSAVPTVKISTNSQLAKKKAHWIDFDAGPLVDGAGMDEMAKDFYEYVLSVASGETRAKSESLDKSGFAIFKNGVTL